MAEKIERRPFPESVSHIILTISQGCGPHSRVETLAQLIKTTQIENGHDEISEAWRKLISYLHIYNDLGVLEALKESKIEAEAETRQQQETEQRLMREDALEH
jgi:hypothetical protein